MMKSQISGQQPQKFEYAAKIVLCIVKNACVKQKFNSKHLFESGKMKHISSTKPKIKILL